jgi:hypothetical protein
MVFWLFTAFVGRELRGEVHAEARRRKGRGEEG